MNKVSANILSLLSDLVLFLIQGSLVAIGCILIYLATQYSDEDFANHVLAGELVHGFILRAACCVTGIILAAGIFHVSLECRHRKQISVN